MRDLLGGDRIGKEAQAQAIPAPAITIAFRAVERIGTEDRQLRHLRDVHRLHRPHQLHRKERLLDPRLRVSLRLFLRRSAAPGLLAGRPGHRHGHRDRAARRGGGSDAALFQHREYAVIADFGRGYRLPARRMHRRLELRNWIQRRRSLAGVFECRDRGAHVMQ